MKTKLLFLSVIMVSFSYAQELIVIDLNTTNEITITATTGTSSATISGSDTTGFYFDGFFPTAVDEGITNTLVSGDLTTAENTSDGSPSIFRSGTTDTGLNVWSFTNDADAIFITGNQAFSGSGTWSLTPEDYAAMLTAPETGNIYFPADEMADVAGATLIGTYRVTSPAFSVPDIPTYEFSFAPNPVKDVVNISSQQEIAQVDIYNMLGQSVSTQRLNAVNGVVNTSFLTKGAYFLKATFQDGITRTLKILKN